MLEVGADPNALDINNKTPSYYLEYSENISLPNNSKSDCTDEGNIIYIKFRKYKIQFSVLLLVSLIF